MFFMGYAIEGAANPVRYLEMALEQAKVMVADAVERNDPDALMLMNAQADELAVYAKRLSRDAQLTAMEIRRRCERGLGLAVRAGQDRGTIRSLNDSHTIGKNVRARLDDGKRSPTSYFSGTQSAYDVYRMVDGVSDEQFELALKVCRELGDLARTKVTRRARQEVDAPIVMSTGRHKVFSRTPRLNSNQIVGNIVQSVEGVEMAVALVNYADLDRDRLDEWIDGLRDSLRALGSLKARLLEEKAS